MEESDSIGRVVGACVASILDHCAGEVTAMSLRLSAVGLEVELTLPDGDVAGPVLLMTRRGPDAGRAGLPPLSDLYDDPFWPDLPQGALHLVRSRFGAGNFETLAPSSDGRYSCVGGLGGTVEEAMLLGLDPEPDA